MLTTKGQRPYEPSPRTPASVTLRADRTAADRVAVTAAAAGVVVHHRNGRFALEPTPMSRHHDDDNRE